jgi:antitoxin CcdA
MRMKAAQVRKVPTNLSVRSDLVRRAKSLNINLSELLEEALEGAVRERERDEWLSENDQAISDYNEAVSQRPLFGDDWRRF